MVQGLTSTCVLHRPTVTSICQQTSSRMQARVHRIDDRQEHNKVTHPSLKVSKELLEGNHVGRLDGFCTLFLLGAASVLGNGSI